MLCNHHLCLLQQCKICAAVLLTTLSGRRANHASVYIPAQCSSQGRNQHAVKASGIHSLQVQVNASLRGQPTSGHWHASLCCCELNAASKLKSATCSFCLPAIAELGRTCKLNFLLMGQAGAGLQKLASHAISGAAMLSIMLGSVSPALAEPLFPSLTEKTQPTEVQKSPLQEMKVCLGPLTLMTCGLYA